MIKKVFVYGTLRPNQALYRAIKNTDHTHKPAMVQGDLFLNTGGWFPVFKSGNGVVIGDILTFDEDSISNVLDTLDAVEGAPYLYERKVVTTEDGEECFIYEGNEARCGEQITSGDFIQHMSS